MPEGYSNRTGWIPKSLPLRRYRRVGSATTWRANDPRAAHTNMDTYDHVLEEDLKQSSAVAAYIIYELAVRDSKVPRKPVPAH